MNTGFPISSNQLNMITSFDRWNVSWDVPASAGYGEFVGSIATAGQQFNMIDIGTGLNGSAVEFDEIKVKTNKNVYLQLLGNTYPSGDTTVMPRIPGPDMRLDVDGKDTFRGPFKSLGQMQYRINAIQQAGQSGINISDLRVTATLVGLRRSSINPFRAADKVIYYAGDSITALTSVGVRSYRPAAFHIYQTVDFINDAYAAVGSDLLLGMENKAIGSQTIFDFVKFIEWRVAEIPKCDIFMLCYGVNEAQGNMDPALFRSYLEIVWKWFRRTYRNSHMVVCASTPLNNDVNEARLAILRDVMAQFVYDMNDPRLTGTTKANTFDRLVLSNYNNMDGVHPGIPATWSPMAAVDYTHILNDAHCRSVLQLPAL